MFTDIKTNIYKTVFFLALILLAACGKPPVNSKPKIIPGANYTKWSGIKQYGKLNNELTANSISHDNLGNIYISGINNVSNGLTFPDAVTTSEIYITKYNSSGVLQWIKSFGKSSTAMIQTSQKSVVVDGSNNIYLILSDDTPISSSVPQIGGMDVYVIKIDTNGNQLWIKNFSPAALTTAGAVATGSAFSSDGNIIISGNAWGGSFTGGVPGATSDLFVMKIDTNGNRIWAKQTTISTSYIDLKGIALDGSDNIFVVGSESRSDSGDNGFAIKMDSTGTIIWKNSQGVMGGTVYFNSVTASAAGDIYLVGTGTQNFGGLTLIGGDSFIMRINSNGTTSWKTSLGNNVSTNIILNSVVNDGSNIYVSGYTNGPFKGLSLIGSSTESFIIKYDFLGDKKWLRQIGEIGAGSVYEGSLDITSSDSHGSSSIFMSGDTNSLLDNNVLSGGRYIFISKYDQFGTRL